jgi:DMSO/TMAO reductase YedYZ molybdopterin-dependent catalytic subunit
MNGEPLLPQHGYPVRLIVPGWYGMTHVKWLSTITVTGEEFRGWQQEAAYRMRQSEDEAGTPVTRMVPRSLLVPPGIPEFLSRSRFLEAGPIVVEGRAWSGLGPIERVEFSADGGASWTDAKLDSALSPYAWAGWRITWDAAAGEHELCCRATDAAGNTQPAGPAWNLDGYCNNAVQRVSVTVS